ncbi:hypothetical protein KJ934_01415 [Patescibacteria group bacterium]|nr:hypothetical protein [Patescibacteria group bacterium]MBU4353253.1 hypothetical protein [Patescibacteria group bacterium]MBU4477149.1 hypothetical protein [Patescibacteria group bacterium]MCG2698922.1 hypothetical protein [Candidatus Parcubacteria bacterium]
MEQIGKVIHYFDKAMVAVIRLNDKLSVGDIVKFIYADDEFVQKIESMEVERQAIQFGEAGEEVAVKVERKTHEGAKVFREEG